MADQCTQCGKDKVANYPECQLILDDLATTEDIKNNNGWKLILDGAFRLTQQIRCDFMKFMIDRKIATPDAEREGFYQIPEDVHLHPQTMTDLEQELIQIARSTTYTDKTRPDGLFMTKFHNKVEEYQQRVRAFFDGQFEMLTKNAE